MVRKLMWCVVFFTLFFSSFYTGWAEDIKNITFMLSSYDKCEDVPNIDIKVGEQFRVHVDTHGKDLHNVARCLKTQETASEYVETTFKEQGKNGNLNRYTSIQDVNVTRPGNWKYECIFYFFACRDFVKNKCKYKWYGGWYENDGVKCSSQVYVKNVVNPSGYLTANTTNFNSSVTTNFNSSVTTNFNPSVTTNFNSSDEEYIYKFQDGETTNFTCHVTTGYSANILYAIKGEKLNSTKIKGADLDSIYMELGVENNDTTLDCIITGDYDLEKVIRLRFIAEEDGGIWVVVSSVILLALLIAAGLCILFTYKKRKPLLKNDLSLVILPSSRQGSTATSSMPRPDDETYAEPYSLTNKHTNEPINAQEDANKEHIYLNTQQLDSEPTYVSVHGNAPNYVAVHNSEPNFASVKNCELNFATVKNKPNSASVINSEPNSASVKNCEPNFASVQHSKDNVSLNVYQNHKKIKIKDTNKIDNKKSSKVGKNKKDSNSHDKEYNKNNLESKKISELMYADLCHENTNISNFASKVLDSSHDSKDISHDYENAVNNCIEPTYSEIIPTKQ